MKALIQRVDNAHVEVDGEIVSSIENGMLVFLGVEKNDKDTDIYYIADKIVNMRIFDDAKGNMNYSLLQSDSELLIVSQFTLAADLRKGRRPGFDKAMRPDEAERLYRKMIEYIKNRYEIDVCEGCFGKHMKIGLVNDGPVTFILESQK